MFDSTLYTRTLLTAAADQPDFYLTIGDDFSVDLIPTNQINNALVTARYTLQRPYLGLIGNSAPLFLVNGNHEQAALYLTNGTPDSVAVWAQNARNSYYPQPAPDSFYSGNTNPVPYIGLLRNYYAWTWGDALFVTIDPYWGSPTCVDNNYWTGVKRTNLWDITHGDAQYQWLKQTLEQSTAKYKFVFAHHVLGTGRGGTDDATFYEWGGQNGNGSWGFTTNRPAWPAPIHQLMVANNVTAFIQGHDHIWVRQELDGVTYQTLPNPADPNYATINEDAFATGVKLPNSGYTRFTVAPAGVKVDYVRTFLPADEGAGQTNGMVAYSYIILPLTVTGTTNSAALPTQPVWVTSTIIGGTNISLATLTYIVAGDHEHGRYARRRPAWGRRGRRRHLWRPDPGLCGRDEGAVLRPRTGCRQPPDHRPLGRPDKHQSVLLPGPGCSAQYRSHARFPNRSHRQSRLHAVGHEHRPRRRRARSDFHVQLCSIPRPTPQSMRRAA